GLRLLACHARFQTSDQFKIGVVATENVYVAIGHHIRYPDVIRGADPCPLKSGWRDTNDGEDHAIQLQTSPNTTGVAVEAPFPEAVAQHCHGIPAGNAVLIRQKETAE